MDDPTFVEVAERAASDHNVVALIVGGGRGKGQSTVTSDYDIYLILADSGGSPWVDDLNGNGMDVVSMTLPEFREYGAFGGETEWNRYTFAHVTATLDKTEGDVQAIVDAMEAMPPDIAAARTSAALDDFLNLTYRSLKNRAIGAHDGATLDAAESIGPLLTAVFAIEARVRPFNKFLRWEMGRHPLEIAPWGSDELVRLVTATARADEDAQRQVARGICSVARDVGCGEVIDAWDDDALRTLGLDLDLDGR